MRPVAHRAVEPERRVRVDDRHQRSARATSVVAVDAADERRRPRARRRRRSRPKPRHCHVLSSSVANVRYMSRWRVSTGRSVGSSGPPPSWWMTSRAADQPDVVDEVGDVAGAPAAVEVGHEGRAADRAEHEVVAAEEDVPLRVPGVELELTGRQRDELLDVIRVEPDAARRVVDVRAVAHGTGRAPGRRAPRRRSRTGSAATPDGSPRPRRRTGSRSGGTGCAASATGAWPTPAAARRGRRRTRSSVIEPP